MLKDSDPTFQGPTPTRYDRCAAEFRGLSLWGVHYVAQRFSLVRGDKANQQRMFVRDIISSASSQAKEHAAHQRFLVVDKDIAGLHTYGRLNDAGVPQLPIEGETENLVVFRVPSGAKQLRKEPFFGLGSTATYIGDQETYREAGRIFGKAWMATGEVFVQDGADDPTSRLAVVNFSDKDRPYLFLCPPYAGSQAAPDHQQAETILRQSLSNAQHRPEVANAMTEGFRATVLEFV